MSEPAYIVERFARIGSVGGLEKARRELEASRERVAAAQRGVLEHAVTWKRADELRTYWRSVKAITESSTIAPAEKRKALDDLYRHTFPAVAR